MYLNQFSPFSLFLSRIRSSAAIVALLFFLCSVIFGPDGVIDREAATVERMGGPGGKMYSFCRDTELWLNSPQFLGVYRAFQACVPFLIFYG